jgi:hypothetical protein
MFYEEVSVKLIVPVANSWVVALQASSPGRDICSAAWFFALIYKQIVGYHQQVDEVVYIGIPEECAAKHKDDTSEASPYMDLPRTVVRCLTLVAGGALVRVRIPKFPISSDRCGDFTL